MEAGTLTIIGVRIIFYVFFGFMFGHISWEIYHDSGRRGMLFRILWPLSMFPKDLSEYHWGPIGLFGSKWVYIATMVVLWPLKLLAMVITGIIFPVVAIIVGGAFLFFLWLSIPSGMMKTPPAASKEPSVNPPTA